MLTHRRNPTTIDGPSAKIPIPIAVLLISSTALNTSVNHLGQLLLNPNNGTNPLVTIVDERDCSFHFDGEKINTAQVVDWKLSPTRSTDELRTDIQIDASLIDTTLALTQQTASIKSTIFFEELFNEYRGMVAEKYLDDAILLLLERIDQELSKDNFGLIEDLFFKVSINEIDIESSLAILSATYNAKEFLPSRWMFLDSVKDHLLTTRTRPEVDELLNGLD